MFQDYLPFCYLCKLFSQCCIYTFIFTSANRTHHFLLWTSWKWKITRTIQTCVNTAVQAVKPDIAIEDIQNNNEQVLYYTGLPDFETFNALFESLKKIRADRMNVDDCTLMAKLSLRKLRLVDEFLMVLMRLRLGLLVNDL